MSKPVAIGPTSRTVVGAVTADSPPSAPKKTDWKKFVIPAGFIGLAVYLTMRYKGHA